MFKKLLGKKITLNPEIQVEIARGKVSQAFEMFKNAQKAVIEANLDLASAISEHEKNISSLVGKISSEQISRNKAIDEIKANEALATRLSELVPN